MNTHKGADKYVLAWEKLESCDIVLSRVSLDRNDLFNPAKDWDALKSHMIRMGSKDYSHAMLYFEGSILHAHPPMVFASNPQRLCVLQQDDCLCLRCPILTAGQKRRIEAYAREHVGALYSTMEAAQTPLRKKGKTCSRSGKEFCSRLVAEAYAAAGILLVKNPSFCAPGDFLRSKNLNQVKPCTRIATDADIGIILSKDFVLLSQKRTYELLKNVRTLAKQDGFKITTFKSVVEYVRKHSTRDAEVEKLFIKTHYFDTWKEEASVHGYRYNLLEFSALSSLRPRYAKAEISGMFDCAGRYGDALLFLDDIDSDLRTISQIVTCYREMLKDIAKRLLIPIALNMGKPEVGPLTKLHAICDHLVGGTYRQLYSLGVIEEIQQLKCEWQQASLCSEHLVGTLDELLRFNQSWRFPNPQKGLPHD